MSRVRVEGARVVITGAGSGIGKATALRCAKAGAEVVCVDIDGEAAQATAGECGGAAYVCDVADPDAVVALAEAVEREQGPVDVLVNNAGVGVAGRFLDASLEDWAWLRSINLDGVVHGCHAFGRTMVERRHGHVVNIASAAAYVNNCNLAAYCASKAAVVSFSQCLRADWRRHGVGVSVICPGVIDTPIASSARMVGAMEGKQARVVRALRFAHSADVVAKAIVSAFERNHDLVPVGLESTVAFRLLRLAPGPIQSLVARSELP